MDVSDEYYSLDKHFDDIDLKRQSPLCDFPITTSESVRLSKSLFNLKINVSANQKLAMKVENEKGPVYLRKIKTTQSSQLIVDIYHWEIGNYTIYFIDSNNNDFLVGTFTIK